MIAVNEAYKEAIKSPLRQLNSFVELLVDGRYIRAIEQYGGISSNDKAEITVLNTVTNDNSAFCNYASLERDYFLLDGSFILPNLSNNKETGFIGDINTSSLNISNIVYETPEIERNKNCITIYFENGYATNFTVTLEVDYNEGSLRTITYNYTNNDKKIVTTEPITDLANFKNIVNINVTVNNWSNPNHRVRIRQINLGETIIYESNEIIQININEQTDIYNIDFPDNECSIELNNYDRKFNVVDESNILNRLNSESIIRPYFGISIGGSYEYLCMGNYGFSSYSDNNNDYTVFNGVGNVEALETNYAYLEGSSVVDTSANRISDMILDNSLDTSNTGYNMYLPMLYTDFANKREQLQAIAMATESYIKQTRENEYYNSKNITKVLEIPNEVVDTITLDDELGQPKFTKRNKTSKFVMTNKIIGTLNENEDILFEETVVPYYDVENGYYRYNFVVTTDMAVKIDTIKAYVNDVLLSSSDFRVIEYSYFQLELSAMHLTGEPITLKVTAQKYNTDNQTFIYENNKGETLEINNNYIRNDFDKRRIVNYITKLEKPYTFEFDMMGDPSLEIGDTILFENIDGYKKGIITTIEYKYTGGLTATIKGECENVL